MADGMACGMDSHMVVSFCLGRRWSELGIGMVGLVSIERE
jgi:hypothetical protein